MKRVLVSGGSGSFGNAFVRRILEHDPERVVIYSRDESKQDTMAHELSGHRNFSALRLFIGDVRDADRLRFAMHDISTVIHAAALKIITTAEYNPTECIATNVTGAENIVKASIKSGVKKVIALSTDKAVNPVNLYGASKLAAEKIFIDANYLSAGATKFALVRYGNVASSRGSVIPFFKKLIAEGKPLTVTDERMTRFNITMDEAIDLVLLAHEKMRGRDIFIPKLPSFKIIDLAASFGGEIKIVGIRPGEKLHECLMTEDESRNAFDFGSYYLILETKENLALRVGEGFRYTSDKNEDWLSLEQIAELTR